MKTIEQVDRYVDELVLEAFVGPAPEGHIPFHIDGNTLNDRLDNLRWDKGPRRQKGKRNVVTLTREV
jgi:hypothetical protein